MALHSTYAKLKNHVQLFKPLSPVVTLCTTRFDIHRFYIVLTLRFSVLHGLVSCKMLTDLSRMTEVEWFFVFYFLL